MKNDDGLNRSLEKLVEQACAEINLQRREQLFEQIKEQFAGGKEGFSRFITKVIARLSDPEHRQLAIALIAGLGPITMPYLESAAKNADDRQRPVILSVIEQIYTEEVQRLEKIQQYYKEKIYKDAWSWWQKRIKEYDIENVAKFGFCPEVVLQCVQEMQFVTDMFNENRYFEVREGLEFVMQDAKNGMEKLEEFPRSAETDNLRNDIWHKLETYHWIAKTTLENIRRADEL